MTDSQEHLIAAIALFVFGLPLGSFLNVVAHRLPRGQTPWRPKRSNCPACRAEIRPRDNIPVLSWLFLRGRCRDCGAAISWRYPAFELLTALLFAADGAYRGLQPELVPDLLLIATLVVVVQTDLEFMIVPNKVVYPAFLAGAVAQAAVRPDEWVTWGISALAASGFLLTAALVYPRGMGMGDVKLAAVLGLLLGRAVVPAMMIAFLAGSLVGFALMAKLGVAAGRKVKVPFAVFLAFGAVIAIFVGEDIVSWYLDSAMS